jgi:hypothetical protein
MSTRFEPFVMRKRFQVPLRRSLEVSLLILMLIALQLIEPLSRMWVRDVISQSATDQQLSSYADEIVIHALMARRFEKDILLNLADPVTRNTYVERWTSAVTELELAINNFRATADTAVDQVLADDWQSSVNAYRAVIQQVLQAIEGGNVTTPTEANALLDSGKRRPIRELTNSALAIAETKEQTAQASSEALRSNLAASARIIVLVLMAALLFSTFRHRS